MEDGFLESAGKYMGHWFSERHNVMQAILTNALNEKHPKQREWAEWYLELTEPREQVAHPASRLVPTGNPADLDPDEKADDDDEVVDFSP